MADYTIPIQRKDDTGKTMYASLATLDNAKTPKFAPYDPDADQAYLDQAMTETDIMDDGDAVYNALSGLTVKDGFATSGTGVVLLHTGTIGVSADFSGVTMLDVLPLGVDSEIAKDWLDGGRLDVLLDAVSAPGGSGARTVTVTVNDGSTALESASVRFSKGAESYLQTTDASGNCTFNLDDGTWTVAITLAGYTFSGTTQVVDGDETPTYSMSVQTITAPSDALLCTVQFRVKLSNTAVQGAVCKARLQGINQASDGTILSNAESSDTTDASGIAELQLVRKDSIVKGNGLYDIWVEINGKPVANLTATIPNQSTFLFEDMLGA